MQHYPHRLHQLYVVDLPSQLRWVLATIKPLLHPQTKEKIRTVSNSDPALPLPTHLLHSPRADSATAEVPPSCVSCATYETPTVGFQGTRGNTVKTCPVFFL